MTSTRTTVRVGALALGLGLAVSACGFGGDSGDDSGSGGATLDLLVPSYSDGTQALWEGIIKDFEAENSDIKVNLEVQSWDNINDVVRTKVQSDDAPDILNIDAFAGFAADDLLYPAAEVVSEDTLGDFQDSFAENASIGDEQIGLPLIASARTMFVNTDLMDKAGVTAVPATWDELLAAAKKVSALGGGVYGYGMPLGNEEAQAETSIWAFGNGGGWGDADKITVDTPENLEAVEFMKTMIDEKATQPDPGATDRTPLINVFMQGKIGFIEALPPTVGEIEKNNPELKYELAPIPTKDGEPVTLGVADHLMAFKNDDDKKDAITTFLDYFYSTDVYMNFVTTENFLPVTKSGAEAYDNADLQVFLDALPDAQFYPSTNSKWSATQGAFQSLVGQIGQGKDAAAVLKEIQAKADG
ncbi:MAG: extracellular solute-binding protein [Propionibacteriales bacterium]|nr:extracellular solute-binding protein [Propionibacteriales bacterium]